MLISQGLNFFDAARFVAIPERWYRNTTAETDSVLQCYRCQGFWHVAANCRHLPRCVRCGESHGVEFCLRPRNNPICCHCSGAHHAAYKKVKHLRLYRIDSRFLTNAHPLGEVIQSQQEV